MSGSMKEYDRNVSSPPQSIPVTEAYLPIPKEPDTVFKQSFASRVCDQGGKTTESGGPIISTCRFRRHVQHQWEVIYGLFSHLSPTRRQAQGQVAHQDLGRFVSEIGLEQTASGGEVPNPDSPGRRMRLVRYWASSYRSLIRILPTMLSIRG
jgi:hypothetical protein